LTGKMVAVRYARDRIIPRYLDVNDPGWREVAERLLALFRGQEGRTRGELEEDLKETFGDDPSQIVHQGLAKLLEDRCEFEVVSGHPPEELRELVFGAAMAYRRELSRQRGERTEEPAPSPSAIFDRTVVLEQVAASVGLTAEQVDQGLFADLKSQQRLTQFKDTTAERLLQRYNVALAQAVLLRSTQVQVTIHNEPPRRFRQL